MRHIFEFFFSYFLLNIFDEAAKLDYCFVGKFNTLEHHTLLNLVCSGFDHYDLSLCACNGNKHLRLFSLR